MLAHELAASGRRDMAAATMLTFVFMLRPAETMRLQGQDLVAPVPLGARARQKWSLVLHPLERGVTSKTGEFDDTLLLDNPEFAWMGDVLSLLQEQAGRGPLWRFSQSSWVEHFRAAGMRLGLTRLGPPILYQLRHGGASHEALTGFRDAWQLQQRGRWRSETSVRRYAKGGRVNQVLALLDAQLLRHARGCECCVGNLLLGKSQPRRAPLATA